MQKLLSVLVIVLTISVPANSQIRPNDASGCPKYYFKRGAGNEGTHIVFRQVVIPAYNAIGKRNAVVGVIDITIDPLYVNVQLDPGVRNTAVSILDGYCGQNSPLLYDRWYLADSATVWTKTLQDKNEWNEWLFTAQEKRRKQITEWRNQSKHGIDRRVLPPKN